MEATRVLLAGTYSWLSDVESASRIYHVSARSYRRITPDPPP